MKTRKAVKPLRTGGSPAQPPFDPTDLVRFVRDGLLRLSNTEAAASMAAYMKTTQPFYGVMNTPRCDLTKEACARFQPVDAAAWRAGVMALFEAGKGSAESDENTIASRSGSKMRPPVWRGEREFFYAACDFAGHGKHYHTASTLPMFKTMIVQSGWWDTVDWIAGKMVGRALDTDPAKVTAVMERWIEDRNLWVRRSAVICQLHRKQNTDTEMLGRFCLARAHETDFFMRKAIGWSLRQHAHTDPVWVRRFLKANGERLSPLSLREASKHL